MTREFRERYRLLPRDPRYLECTEREIFEDCIEHNAADELREQWRKESVPTCTVCEYAGAANADSSCPKCGGVMIVGTVYRDEELEKRIDAELAGKTETVVVGDGRA